jgi:hypothetical protein
VTVAALALLGPARDTTDLHALTWPAADAALGRASAAAIRGTVLGVAARRDATGAIYTHVLLDVARVWGFSTPPAQVVIKLLGGSVDGLSLAVGGQARFAPGEEVFAFLDVRPRDQTLSVTGLERGKWTLRVTPGETSATRTRHGTHDETADPAALERLAALAGSQVRLPPALADTPSAAETDALAARGTEDAGAAIAARWHEADWGAAVPVDSAPNGHPLFPSGGLTQFLRALDAWNRAGSLRLAPGVIRSARCFANDEAPDGRISVTYDDPCGEIADTSPVLAIGGVYYSSSEVRQVSGTPFGKITKGMVVMDNALPKFAGMSTGCYEELLTHEVGHAIGLGHTAHTPSVMAPALSAACANRTESLPLQPPDLAALAVHYPLPAVVSGPPAPPGGLAAEVAGARVTLRWSPAAGAPATAYQVQAGSMPGAADHGTLATELSSVTVTGVATGVYYVRVIALNAAGASAPSIEIVVVAGSGLPAAPTGLVAAAGGSGSVRVFWQPPPGATPAGYVFLAGYTPETIAARVPLGGPAFTAEHVAAGTYYVRVAAMNGVGLGPASDVITILVP